VGYTYRAIQQLIRLRTTDKAHIAAFEDIPNAINIMSKLVCATVVVVRGAVGGQLASQVLQLLLLLLLLLLRQWLDRDQHRARVTRWIIR